MILKGGSRRGANDLALHLTNEVDNERVVVAETRGMVADNLYDGFREWELICNQTKAKEPFYSLSINPDPNQREWTDAEWQRAIGYVEDKLGLTGQPRAIIFHEKEGEDGKIRRHAHVVWSRIKYENGKFKAIHMGQDHYKLKTCARDLAKEFGLHLPHGLSEGSKTDSLSKPCEKGSQENYDFAKSHGKGCDPQTVADRKKRITKIWRETEGAEEFSESLRKAGYVLAKGNKRAFVVVDREGVIHALARQIAGVKTKEIKQRLGNADAYPNIEQAMDEIRIRENDSPGIKDAPSKQRADLSKEQRLLKKLRRMVQRADQLNISRQARLQKEQVETEKRHQRERDDLKRRHRALEVRVLRMRYKKKPEGVLKHLRAVFGYEMLLRWQYHLQDKRREKQFSKACQFLRARQVAELHRLERKAKRLRKHEVREAQCLNRLMKRLGQEGVQKTIRQQEQRKQNSQGLRLSYA